jgi:ParB family chromosome partitioning protein
VCNLLRLLTLDHHVQELIGEGEQHISVGHAKILAGIAKHQERALAQRLIHEHLSVRQLERIVKAVHETAAHARPGKDPNVAQLELHLTDHLGQKVRIEWSEQGGGEVRIQFSSTEELEGFFKKIGFTPR